jgi:hypothetical protein
MTIQKHPGYAEQKIRLAEGGARNDRLDRHYKGADRNKYGQFLSTKDRFTDGRKAAGFPEEARTEEDWSKPKGASDGGRSKSQRAVKPRA